MKNSTPAESVHSESVWELSQKQLLSKDGDHLSESSQKDLMAKDYSPCIMADPTIDNEKLLTVPVGNTSKKLLSVSSIAKKDNVLCWTELDLPPSVDASKASHAELFEFDTGALDKIKYERADSYDKHVASVAEAGEAVAERAYEGDEDEEFLKGECSRSIQTDHPSGGSRSAEHSADERRSGSSADNGTATYYELHSNMAGMSDTAGGCFFDEEAVGDYGSDPGVYREDSRLGALDKGSEGGQFSRGEDASHFLKKARSEGGLYELGLTSEQHPVQSNEQDLAQHSHESSLCQNVSRQRFSIHWRKNLVESLRSEADLRDAKDLDINSRSLDKASSVKRKPWWKVLLMSHRNIHPEKHAVIARSTVSKSVRLLLSGASGYSSDVDYCSGSPKLELHVSYPRSDVYPGSVRCGSFPKIGEVVECDDENDKSCDEAGVNEDSEAVLYDRFQELTLNPSTSHDVDVNNEQDTKAFELGRPNLSRVEEWINCIGPTPFPVDESEITAYSDTEPSAPADPFFRARARSDQIQGDGIVALDRRNHLGEPLLDADSEMASSIARSVNSLSTVAHFSGVGLKLLPPLGGHSNLKTLNLSANAIVRIVPGCLPKSLHTLDLSRNKIVVIEGLREVSRLRVLNLSYNRIIRIGHGLASCTSLRELHLAGNKISEIEGLHRLLKLSFIDLSFNKLASAKSIGQLAANYSSLQAINLLGNPLHSNLGEESLRKLIIGLAPHVVYLNKQATKAVSARDATVDSVARAALANTTHHTHQRGKTSLHSKPLRRSGAFSTTSSPRHRDKRGGEESGTGHGGSRTGALKRGVSSELPPRHRYSHSRHVKERTRRVLPVSPSVQALS